HQPRARDGRVRATRPTGTLDPLAPGDVHLARGPGDARRLLPRREHRPRPRRAVAAEDPPAPPPALRRRRRAPDNQAAAAAARQKGGTLQRSLADAKRDLATVQHALIEAAKQRKVMEKLREREQSRWLEQERRREQVEADEIAAARRANSAATAVSDSFT